MQERLTVPYRGWRKRLAASVKADGRSLREISLAAGLGHNYLHTVLKVGKEPRISQIGKLAETLGVSISWLMEGIEIDPDSARLLRIWAKYPPENRQGFLDFLAGPIQETEE
jgi:transcriptional regulator with XRE-family HTH domain